MVVFAEDLGSGLLLQFKIVVLDGLVGGADSKRLWRGWLVGFGPVDLDASLGGAWLVAGGAAEAPVVVVVA